MDTNDTSTLWATLFNNRDQMGCSPVWLIFLALLFGPQAFNKMSDPGLAQTIADNHNTDLLMAASKGNADAARELAGQLNVGIGSVTAAISALGSRFSDCCCESKMETLKMGYENQLENLRQTNTIQAGFANTNGILAKGFADIGYAAQAQTCELKTNQNENTQKIIDTLNAHWGADLQQRYNDARLELSQLRQNETIIAALRPA